MIHYDIEKVLVYGRNLCSVISLNLTEIETPYLAKKPTNRTNPKTAEKKKDVISLRGGIEDVD